MNKYKFLSFFLLIILAISQLQAQDKHNENPVSHVNVLGRYVPDTNIVELRFFPDKKRILELGIKEGFIIERAEMPKLTDSIQGIEDLKFERIGTSRAYGAQQWTQVMSKLSDKDKKDMQLAKDFYESIGKDKGGTFSLDQGIKDLKEQKGKEDFEYMVFALTAIKNKNVAQALGVSFVDKTVTPGKTYFYRVKPVKQDKIYEIHPLVFSLETKVHKQENKRKIYVKEGDGKLSFLWEEKDMVSGAIIERKDPITGKWEQLNKAPIYTLGHTIRNSFDDKNLENYVTYEYRFYGFTPFGEKVLFGTAKGMPRDLTPPKKPIIKSAKHTKPNEITIKWTVNPPLDPDLKGFLIARGVSNKGKFKILNKKVLHKKTRKFIDRTFRKDTANYYVVQAIDTAGNISSTIPAFVTLIDSIPPQKPKFISGKIDSTGIVTIKIALNKEKDLMGYRLYRANSDKHEFSVIREGFDDNDNISKPVQTIFKDTVTLNSLTPYIYYKVKALDNNFNQSEFSDVLKVKRPDKIPPITPVFKKVKVGKDYVKLGFALSESRDVIAHYIYRKETLNAPWTLLTTLKNNVNEFTDRKVKQGKIYYYSIRAKDDSNNFSDYAIPVKTKPYDDGVRPVVRNIKITINNAKNQAILTWQYPDKFKNAYFVVYKRDKKGHFKQYKSIKEKKVIDNKYKEKDIYAIKVFTGDGGESKLSETIK